MAHGPAGGGTAPGSEGRAGREETRAKASQRRANPGKEEVVKRELAALSKMVTFDAAPFKECCL